MPFIVVPAKARELDLFDPGEPLLDLDTSINKDRLFYDVI